MPKRLRPALGKLIDAAPEDIILGNSTTYGLDLLANAMQWQPGDEVLVVDGDFPADIFPWLILRNQGVTVRFIEARSGRLEPQQLAREICAATALRSSEILALRWADVLWGEGRIRVSKRWAKGEDGETKTDASDGYVPLHPVLAGHLRAWQRQTPHAKATDFVFPSMRAEGRKPLCSSVFVADHLRPAAKKAGVHIEDGQRFGLHNLRHSLSNWLVNKAKVEPKTVQGLLRHSKIQTTLDLYTQEDSDETRAAQGEFLTAVGMNVTVQ